MTFRSSKNLVMGPTPLSTKSNDWTIVASMRSNKSRLWVFPTRKKTML